MTEIRKIISDQINRHVAMTQDHRAWLAKDIADRVCAIVTEDTTTLRRDSERLKRIVGAMHSFGRTLCTNDVEHIGVSVPLHVYRNEGKEAALKAAFP